MVMVMVILAAVSSQHLPAAEGGKVEIITWSQHPLLRCLELFNLTTCTAMSKLGKSKIFTEQNL